MALSMIQTEGLHISSNFPKALFHPPQESYYSEKNNNLKRKYIKPTKSKFSERKKIENQYFSKLPSATSDELQPFGFQSSSVQTNLYLEELCNVIEEVDAECETEPFFDFHTSTILISPMVGQDAETQVDPDQFAEFDEIKPILEQSIQQSSQENIFNSTQSFYLEPKLDHEATKNIEMPEIINPEERNVQAEEKVKWLREDEEDILLETEIAQKIAACTFSQQFLSKLIPDVYKKLEGKGYFDTEDLYAKNAEDLSFWPWLINEVDNEIATLEASCNLLDSLIENKDFTQEPNHFQPGIQDVDTSGNSSKGHEQNECLEDKIEENLY